MRGADGDTLAPGGAAATENGGAGVGLHARSEAVSFRTVAPVGLKGTFGHGNPLLFSKENLLFSNSLSISQAKFGCHPGDAFTMWQGGGEIRRMLRRVPQK